MAILIIYKSSLKEQRQLILNGILLSIILPTKRQLRISRCKLSDLPQYLFVLVCHCDWLIKQLNYWNQHLSIQLPAYIMFKQHSYGQFIFCHFNRVIIKSINSAEGNNIGAMNSYERIPW